MHSRQLTIYLFFQVFEINELKSFSAVALTAGAVALSVWLIGNSPWYLLPFVYAYTSAAWTGVSAGFSGCYVRLVQIE